MNLTLEPILKDLKDELTALYRDRLIYLTLFGSQARGDQDLESDIDVLVVLQAPVNPGEEIQRTGKIVADISLNYDVVISCIFMDKMQYHTHNNALLRNIRKDGVLL
ncbi:nucleotidyltransferase [Phormidium willei BDU 130791]|nr:nucleotidyltransferase [Phormidium willei BDU 130791]